MELLEKLNPKQKEAVLHKEGPLLLLAGAGSGKTRVLTHRISYLIENGIKPWHILAITFTNKAAKEMRERINSLVEKGSEDIWVKTFHSMCVRILRHDIEKIGYKRNFSIYDMSDQEKLIKECLDKLKFSDKLFTSKGVMAEISGLKNELITCKQYEKISEADFRQSKVARIYSMYQKKLKENNALDFDDLIFKTVDLFTQVPEVLDFYQEKFKYIMVDEYQDTNTAQYQLVRHLSAKYENLCVVGDDDQSIYGWRGANIRNILDFEKDFPNAVTIKLEQNYRSTQNILYAANAVIGNNKSRKYKSLWTENDEGTGIYIMKTPTQSDEASFIANEIKNLVKEGKKYNEFALLYRTNAQSRILEEKLVQANITYRLLGGTRFYDRKEIRDILSYLKVLNNLVDDLAIKRIINVPKRGIGNTTINKVTDIAYTEDVNFFEILKRADQISELERSSKKLKDFANFIGVLRQEVKENTLNELIDIILDRTGYIRELKLENTSESLERIENLKEFVLKATEYQNSAEQPSLEGFLEEIALIADIDNYQADADTVVLMTLHSAKGLEFPYVFIAGMEEGTFPSYRSMTSGDENAIEEERRLCYVGITRAKQQLYLIYSQSKMLNGKTQHTKASRFLDEIPNNLIENKPKLVNRKIVEAPKKAIEKNIYRPQFEKIKPYQSIIKTPIPSAQKIDLNFKEGDKVKHKKFGEGIIKQIISTEDDYEILIDFDKVGEKIMMSAVAKLEKF